MPPQHGKSRIASVTFPAYSLGRDDTHDFVSVSAGKDLAQDFGRDVRNMIMSDRGYRATFPKVHLAPDSKAAGRWKTSNGGSYYAVGIGGSLYGRGATRVGIDDPFGSWEDAQSDLKREKVWEWYTGTLYNRVRPGGAIVIIQHRMHEADLVGRLDEKERQGGDKWHRIELPAIKDGKALWPERYGLEELERIRVNTSPLKWSSLYMQQPMPEEGTYFKREWFEFFDPAKVGRVHKYTTSDFAVTDEADSSDADYTEIGTHGYSTENLYLCLDGWYGQKSADVWIETAIDQMKRHKPLCFFGESGVIRRAIEPFLIRRMRERKAYCRLEWLPKPHNKPTMARGLQGLCAMKKVKIADNEYGHHVLQQMLNFPGGQLDDAVDMAGLMGLAIDNAHPAIIEPPEGHAEPGSDYSYVDDEDEVRGWRVA